MLTDEEKIWEDVNPEGSWPESGNFTPSSYEMIEWITKAMETAYDRACDDCAKTCGAENGVLIPVAEITPKSAETVAMVLEYAQKKCRSLKHNTEQS